MERSNMPLVNALLSHSEKNCIPFHMPGHKENKRGFEELELIRDKLFLFDKTEVNGLDNLHLPEGPIKEAQEMAAKAFKAARSCFLVNGSTCGIYSMITGVTRPGDKILVQRNCHRSIHMAAFIGELNVSYINPEINQEYAIPAGLNNEAVIAAMDQNPDAKAVVLVHPSYYGICSDLESIATEAHKRNMFVLVDEAHGAHFPFGHKLPKPAIQCGADIAVTSIHKSLPALTQASLLNMSERIIDSPIADTISFMLRLYQSTSPSYILMASIDAARNIMETQGHELLEDLLENINDFSARMQSLKCFHLLDDRQCEKSSIVSFDKTKLVINSCIGGRELFQALEKEFGIVPEMADMHNIVLITSIGDTKAQFDRLFLALEKLDSRFDGNSLKKEIILPPEYRASCNMRTAFYSNKEKIKFVDGVGRISAEMVVPYPPGIPVLLPGETITKELLDYIQKIKRAGIQISGMEDNRNEHIKVLSLKNE